MAKSKKQELLEEISAAGNNAITEILKKIVEIIFTKKGEGQDKSERK